MRPQVDAEVLRQLLPLLLMAGGGVVLMLWGAVRRSPAAAQRWTAAVIYLVVIAFAARLWGQGGWQLLGGMLVMDRFSLFFAVLVSLCALGSILASARYAERFGLDRGEFFALLFFSTTGMVVLVSATNLVSLFLGLELMSLPVYVLAGFRRRDPLANEAALKYFILGAFSVAFFLYGVSLIYGLCGTVHYRAIVAETISRDLVRSPLFLLALGLILAGFGFKVSSVPFHMWVPDVYQGAPTPVTSFMATAVKAAAFAALLRLLSVAFIMERARWVGIVWMLAVLTMSLGNIVALAQRNIKRMMAYSSIAHAGYLLVGISSLSLLSNRPGSSVMYYLVAYALMNIGAFAVISAVEKAAGSRNLEVSDYAGLGLQRPLLGLGMATFMFSLAGIPPTAGFFAKYYVFGAAVEAGHLTLVVIAVLNSLVSLYYYLRVVVVMYMGKAEAPVTVHIDTALRAVIVLCILGVLWLGVGPSNWIPGVESFLDLTRSSLADLMAR